MPPKITTKKALAVASAKQSKPKEVAPPPAKCTDEVCVVPPKSQSAPKKKEPLTSPKTSISNDTFYQRYGIRLDNTKYHLAESECKDVFEAILTATTKNFETTSESDRKMLLSTLRKELTECYRGYYLRHLSEAYRQKNSLDALKALIQEDSGINFDNYMIDFLGKRIGRRIIMLEHSSKESGVYGYEVQKVGHTGSWRESPTELGGVSFALPPEHIYYIILSKCEEKISLIYITDEEDHRYYLFPGTHYVVEQINKKE
jgi:hypothetical protein